MYMPIIRPHIIDATSPNIIIAPCKRHSKVLGSPMKTHKNDVETAKQKSDSARLKINDVATLRASLKMRKVHMVKEEPTKLSAEVA